MDWESIVVAVITASAALGGVGINARISSRSETRRTEMQLQQLEDERQTKKFQADRAIYISVAERFLKEISHMRAGGVYVSYMRNESDEHLDDRWLQAEPLLAHEIDKVSDADVRQQLKAIVSGMTDKDLEDLSPATNRAEFREDLLQLGREIAMSAARGEDPDPDTRWQLERFLANRESLAIERRKEWRAAEIQRKRSHHSSQDEAGPELP